jgi:hypothetical protein
MKGSRAAARTQETTGVVAVAELEEAGASRRTRLLRRRRAVGGRPNKVTVVFTDEEFAEVSARAAGQRVTVPHYLARIGLAGGQGAVAERESRQFMLHQLVMLTAQVQRIGVNVNQVTRLLNGTGEVSGHAVGVFEAAQRAITALERSASTWADDGVVPRYRW